MGEVGEGAPPEGIDAWFAPFAYEGAVRDAIAGLKYRNERAGLRLLVDQAVRQGVDHFGPIDELAVVTWPPTTRDRRRRRGFDQAELIARAVARTLRRPAARLLVRTSGEPQTGRSAGERHRAGPRFAPARHVAPAHRPPRARSVLLVDDVATTGATLRAGAACLRSEGYEKVIALTLARTPLKRARDPPDTRSVQPTPSAVSSLTTATVREELVHRVRRELATGAYQPPVDHVVDRLVLAFSARPSTRRSSPA